MATRKKTKAKRKTKALPYTLVPTEDAKNAIAVLLDDYALESLLLDGDLDRHVVGTMLEPFVAKAKAALNELHEAFRLAGIENPPTPAQ